jgi:S-adenosylmethionine:tRNA ribosyltransferase-isomerase
MKSLRRSDFWYNLPQERIAQSPVEPRDSSKMLVYERKGGEVKHCHFFDLPDFLRPGDLLVLNDTKVMAARLKGHKETSGGQVEIFALRRLGRTTAGESWLVLIGGKIKEGQVVSLSPKLKALILKNNFDGTWQVEFSLCGRELSAEMEVYGQVPLPPYIKGRLPADGDRLRYQTVFAAAGKKLSVAAPTAGLHFTHKLLSRLKKNGVRIAKGALHVGIGTFASVKAELLDDHKMHAEQYHLPISLMKEMIATRKNGGRIIAVGTTSARMLESSLVDHNWLAAEQLPSRALGGWTDIFIRPGYDFRAVDGLITNFHLPESTLLMLVAAFLDPKKGLKKEKELYALAIADGYRFFSYGDAMLIL